MSNSIEATDRSNAIDLEAIAWVYNEIEQLLNQTQKTLKRRLRVLTGEQRASDAGGADQTALRELHAYLIRSIKALQIVNMPASVPMLTVIADAVDYVTVRPEELTPEAVKVIDRGCFALLDFLQQILKSKNVNSIGMFPQYRDVANITKRNVQPSDIWFYSWHWADVVFSDENEITAEDLQSAQSRLDKFMLSLLRGQLNAAIDFRTISLGLAASPKDRRSGQFWALVAGFFDAIASKATKLDIYTKRAASHILNIYKSYIQDKFEVNDSFAKELLFFCANRNAALENKEQQVSLPVLDAVLRAYKLQSFTPINYEEFVYGRIDPALIQLAQKRIATAKGTWSSLSAGGPIPVQSVSEAFANLCQSLVQIIPESEQFAKTLFGTVSQLTSQGHTPSAELAMEIATSVLYVEAVFSNLDLNNANLKSRFDRLTERILYVAKGNKPLALDAWIEELYRQVSDRETMGNVVGELHNMLGKVELNIDAFLRKNESSQVLSQATIDLRQMYGVLSVLGLDEAAKASLTMVEQANWLLRHELDASDAVEAQRIELIKSLSNSLGALGFLISMLGYQPLVARQMFVYDDEQKELQLLVEREPESEPEQEGKKEAESSQREQGVAHDDTATEMLQVDSVQSSEYAATQIIPERKNTESLTSEDKGRQSAAEDSIELSVENSVQQEVDGVGEAGHSDHGVAAENLAIQTQPTASDFAVSSTPEEEEFGNNDLRDIFLEEAHEVIHDVLLELDKLKQKPSDHQALLSVRRGFHTLKGSSRMVGLMEFGAAAWACEQCFNEWIAANVSIPEEVLGFAQWAFNQFALWSDDLLNGNDSTWSATVFESKSQEAKVALFEKGQDSSLDRESSEAISLDALDALDDLDDSLADMNEHVVDAQVDAASEIEDSPIEHARSNVTDLSAFDLPDSLDLDGLQYSASDESDDVGESVSLESNFDVLDLPSTLDKFSTDSKSGEEEQVVDSDELSALDLPSSLELSLDDDVRDDAFRITDNLLNEEISADVLSLESDSTFPDTQWLTAGGNTSQKRATTSGVVQEQNKQLAVNSRPIEPQLLSEIKTIGSIKVDSALYSVYIDEAQTKVNKLKHALLRWQAAGDASALEEAEILAHTVAGSSATVGFSDLSNLAKKLERALGAYRQVIDSVTGPLDKSHSLVLWEAGEEVHRMLEEFASGHEPVVDTNIVNTLAQFSDSDFPDSQNWSATQQTMPQVDSLSEEVSFSDSIVGLQDDLSEPEFTDTQSSASVFAFSQIAPEDRTAIESDLFEIFAEEAQDLLPRISEGLRQWSLSPSDLEPLSDVLRALHTLKGSARLAGAMRLGNMSHELESALKHIESKQASLKEVQNILDRVDELNSEFEILCQANVEVLSGLLVRDDFISPESTIEASEVTEADDIEIEDVFGVPSDSQQVIELDMSDEESAPVVSEQTFAHAFEAESATGTNNRSDVFDDQEITADIFAIFKEEAEDLLPSISIGLQNWVSRPQTEYLPEMLRALHTLKGSARLAGAMYLGSIAHDMESLLKETEDGKRTTAAIAQIQDKFVQIEAEFERLCQLVADSDDALDVSSVMGGDPDVGFQSRLPEMVNEDVVHVGALAAEPQPKQQPAQQPQQVMPEVQPQPEQVEQAIIATPDQTAHQAELVLEQPVVSDVVASEAEVPAEVDLENEKAEAILASLDAFDRSVIETDVFKMFRNEAVRLMPLIQEKLFQWQQSPESGMTLVEVLKLLNALRDHIKLASPKRLSDIAHELDLSLRELIGESPSAFQVEKVCQLFEDAEREFAQLCFAADEVERKANEELARHAATEQETDCVFNDSQQTDSTFAPSEQLQVEEVAPVVEKVESQETPPQNVVMPRVVQPTTARTIASGGSKQMLRVRASLVDDLVTKAGEVNMLRSQLAGEARQLKDVLTHELSTNLERLRNQLRDVELQAETQMASRMDAARAEGSDFDPLEFDRYTRIQELTRIMAESVNDVATIQKTLLQTVNTVEDGLAVQSRSARDLQHILLRARMVAFTSIESRFHRIVRLAAKECNKNVLLNINGGEIEIDRAVLDHIAPAFEHILRNCIVHGIESPEKRVALGKPEAGEITITLHQEGNDVSIVISDDGSGLDLGKIRKKAEDMGLIKPNSSISDHDLAQMIYKSGLTTAERVTELAGRGVGLDMAHAEIVGLGGRLEVLTQRYEGTRFNMILPLTTAVTQVAMVKVENKTYGIPINLIESIQRFSSEIITQAIESGTIRYLDEELPVYSLGGLLNVKAKPIVLGERSFQWLVLRSAGQRIVVAVDQVTGSQEVVIKNVGPQFAHLTGFSGMTVLSGGRIILMYNPVALARVFAEHGHLSNIILLPKDKEENVAAKWESRFMPSVLHGDSRFGATQQHDEPEIVRSNKVMVVDDSLTVRRVTQRLLERAGYQVALAKDGQDALDQIAKELPALVLSDIEMPRMDGFEFVRQLRVQQVTKDLPVIMITSRIAQKHHDYAKELGVNHYLGKPFVEDELLKLVRQYVKPGTSVIKK